MDSSSTDLGVAVRRDRIPLPRPHSPCSDPLCRSVHSGAPRSKGFYLIYLSVSPAEHFSGFHVPAPFNDRRGG